VGQGDPGCKNQGGVRRRSAMAVRSKIIALRLYLSAHAAINFGFRMDTGNP
jgi:hypothetical protein